MSDTETGIIDKTPWGEWTQAESGLIRAVYGFDSITVLPGADGAKTVEMRIGGDSVSLTLSAEQAGWFGALLARSAPK